MKHSAATSCSGSPLFDLEAVLYSEKTAQARMPVLLVLRSKAARDGRPGCPARYSSAWTFLLPLVIALARRKCGRGFSSTGIPACAPCAQRSGSGAVKLGLGANDVAPQRHFSFSARPRVCSRRFTLRKPHRQECLCYWCLAAISIPPARALRPPKLQRRQARRARPPRRPARATRSRAWPPSPGSQSRRKPCTPPRAA